MSGSKEVLVARGLDPEPSKTAEMNFLRVVREGDTESVRAYLDVGVGPNVSDEGTEASALELAVELGHLEIARSLLDAGADATAINKREESTLHIAARLGRTELVSLLCERGAPLNTVSARGFSPLALAIHHGQPAVASLLLEAGAEIDQSAETGKNALSVALSSGRSSLADMLLDAGANPNHRMGDDERPLLMQIAVNGPAEMVSLLISRGAQVDAENAFGLTSYQAASAAGREEVALTLRVHGASSDGETEQQLLHDVAAKRVGKVAAALVRGVSPNVRDHHGMNALMHAAKVGSTPILAALIDGDVDLEAKDALGRTALVHACLENQVRAAKRLVDAGVSTGTAGQPTPLTAAAFESSLELVRLLVQAGANVNDCNHLGNTALALAAHHDAGGIADFLLDHGADPTIANNLGHTPLIRAALRGHVAMVHRLIAAGADPNVLSVRGESALGIACGRGDPKVVAALLAGGADASLAAEGDATPLTRARQAGHEGAAEMIATHMTEHVLHVLARSGLAGATLYQAVHDTLPREGFCEWVRMGMVDVVASLIKAGASVESLGCEGDRPLHVAVAGSNLEMVELLVGRGADVNSRDAHGRTPLMRAAPLADLSVVAMLIEAGADVRCRDQYGTVALHAAASAGQVETLKLLVGHGAAVNCSLTYPTPLLRAIQNGQRDAALWLIDAGASVTPRDANGDDALMWAVERGLSDVVGALLAAGADADRPNNANITARTRAERRGEELNHTSMVDALEPLERTDTDRGHIDELAGASPFADSDPPAALAQDSDAHAGSELLSRERTAPSVSDAPLAPEATEPAIQAATQDADEEARAEEPEEPDAEEPDAEEPDAEEPDAEEPHAEEPHAEEPLTLPRPPMADFVPSLRRRTLMDSEPLGLAAGRELGVNTKRPREDDTIPFKIEQDAEQDAEHDTEHDAEHLGVIEISAPPTGGSTALADAEEANAARAAIGVIEIDPSDSEIAAAGDEEDHGLALFGGGDDNLFGREDTYVGHADPQSRSSRGAEPQRLRGESTQVGIATPFSASKIEAESPAAEEVPVAEPPHAIVFEGVTYEDEPDAAELPVRKVRTSRASFAPPREGGRTSVRSVRPSAAPQVATTTKTATLTGTLASPIEPSEEIEEIEVDLDELGSNPPSPPADPRAALWLIAIRIGSIDEVLHALSEIVTPAQARQIVERTLGGAPQLVVDHELESTVTMLHEELERAGGIAKVRSN